ncbi:MAG: CvpA family protein [Clostridiales bacterium]|jgi:uncharacterized membrane protein required for colicin V production|nr:CvpA family protein [Eubacteriales bacterium]MDH7566437.1 CvpA family protein [Clostridiales bacterium]
MNWADYVVLAIILCFAAIGLINGFIFSIFRLASFFVSIAASIKFYPAAADFLLKTAVYTDLKMYILSGLLKQVPDINRQAKQAAAASVIQSLHMPEALKNVLLERIPDPSALVDFRGILDVVSGELARMVIDVISLILLYLLIRIGLTFLRFIFQGLAKLPLFKQMDKLGGLALGAVEGLLTVYILCAVIMLFNAAPQSKPVFEAIDGSVIAKYFYQNNFIIELALPKDKLI